jgi:hypothetical protein
MARQLLLNDVHFLPWPLSWDAQETPGESQTPASTARIRQAKWIH